MRHDSLTYLLLTVLLCISTGFGLQAQHTNITQTNLQYLYDKNAALAFDSRVAMQGSEATIFLKIETRNGSQQSPAVSYEVKSDYKSNEVVLQAELGTGQLLKQEENRFYYRFNLPVSEASKYVFVFATIDIEGVPTELRYDISLETESSFPLTDLVLMRTEEDIPLFENYLTPETSFRIVSYYQQLPQTYIYYYRYQFAPNPPPMASRGPEAAQNMTIDSVFTATLNDSLRFDQQGLYFVQTDTTSLSGISFRVEDEYFPQLVTAESLADPLRYISTSEEIEQILESDDKKEALDRYWMKVARSQDRAKSIIRTYYRQVYEANRLFTTYKEGWKTGQGMVYVLYGLPSRVLREDDREVWVYDAGQDLVDLTFSFVRVKNIYTDQHYNLVPDEEYKKFWFRNIDLWRKGMKSLQ